MHIAFVMDGNGRWASERDLPRVMGHQAGAETVRRVVEHSVRRNIDYLTLYAFSTENWSRPAEEVNALMELFGNFIENELQTMLDNNVKLAIIGDQSRLSPSLRDKIASALEATRENTKLVLAIAINYGGRDEIVRACRLACRAAQEKNLPPDAMTVEEIAAHLDTADMPDPDLVVRTAGEQRMSNFLVWQAAYAELYFTDTRWPDFTERDYDAALEEYARRVRTFGGLGE